VVVNLLAEDAQQHLVVEVVEAPLDVRLDEPGGPVPGPVDLRQRRVATAARPKAVGAVGELRVVERLQDQADAFLEQLVRPGREAEWAQRPVPFRDMHAPDGRPAIPLLAEQGDDPVDRRQAHPVGGFGRGAGRQGAGVPGDLPVGEQVQRRVEQLAVDVLQRQAAPAPFADDAQDGCGVSHLAYLS
jgi:hypothetical protein